MSASDSISPISKPWVFDLVTVALHLLLVALIYGQVHDFDYIHFDDTLYVLWNPQVSQGLGGEGIRWAFSTTFLGNWHPLTWLSHMLDVSLFGTDPGRAHLHNAALHLVNSLLVYLLLLRLGAVRSWALPLSLLFLVHPQHVESVAWIAERKDLLCALFYLLALLAWDEFRRTGFVRHYLLALLAFLAALLSKAMAVTLPVVLLILACWHYRLPLPDWRRVLRTPIQAIPGCCWQLLPFVLLSAIFCVIAVLAQAGAEGVSDMQAVPLATRLANAGWAYTEYLLQFLAPRNLDIFYPYRAHTGLADLLPAVLVMLVTLGAVYWGRARRPLLSIGLAWYLVTLLPVIGLVQIGEQSHADRYMYIPSIGLLLAILSLRQGLPKQRTRPLAALAGLLIGVFSVLCFWQVSYWQDRQTLYLRSLAVSGPHWRIHAHVAEDYLARNEPENALAHAEASANLAAAEPLPHFYMGNARSRLGQFDLAVLHYVRANELGMHSARLYNNLAVALMETGSERDARRAFLRALQVEPGYPPVAASLAHYGKDAGWLEDPPD
ncbi:MAG: hypothetical protein V2I66_10175 [Halieaceae bacterium]|jgi:tetratricopeptide (TPR) repeat protein|nr:hypothetical protein [Halieaceae bacterium]